MSMACAHAACYLLEIDVRLDVRIAHDDLQQKFEHAGYFTSDPLIT